MKFFLLLSVIMANTLLEPLIGAQLGSYRWEKRPVLLFAPSREDAHLKTQLSILERSGNDLDARDIVVLVDADPEAAGSYRQKFKPKGFLFLLIGKDGGVKLKSSEPVSSARLWAIIDAMPMRQREMQEAN